MKDREIARAIAHQSKLKKEKDEVSRLKTELEQSRGRIAELEKTSSEEKQLRVEETWKLKESLEEFESRTTLAEGELATLKTKITRWLAEFSSINGQLDSKLFSSLPVLDVYYFISM